MTAAFVSGAACLASLLVALFFVRFWRDTGNRLFGFFAAGFAVFAVNRLLLTVLDDDSEGRTILVVDGAAFRHDRRGDHRQDQATALGVTSLCAPARDRARRRALRGTKHKPGS